MQESADMPQHQSQMKVHNLSMILGLIRAENNISRIELARKTGMSPTSMTRIVGKLEKAGLVRSEKQKKTGAIGRNAALVALNREAFYTLTVALFQDVICVGLMDFEWDIVLEKQAIPKMKMPSAAGILRQARDLFYELLEESGVEQSHVKSMGVCCTGAVNREKQKVSFSAEFMWTDVDLGGICQELFGLPLVVENDVKAALIAEQSVFYKGEKNIAYLKLEREMQAALMCGGHLLGGHLNAFGNLGHVTVNLHGRKCECGRRGCLNTVLNEAYLVDKARVYAEEVTLADEVMMAYQLKLDWAVSVVDTFAKNVCLAINLLICAYNPAVIVVGGRFFRRYPFLLDLALTHMDELFYRPLSKNIVIEMAAGAHTEGLAGVGVLAQELFLRQMLETMDRP